MPKEKIIKYPKMSEAQKGNQNAKGKHWKLSEERKAKMRKPLPEETKRKMSEIRKKILTLELRKKISDKMKGEKSHFWRGGKSKQCTYKHITDMRWKIWRGEVFQRDNWTCQTCGKRSKTGEPLYLEAHHIKSWANYSEFRYVVDNGITLCKECHLLTHKK